ncbi:photosynthetic protein synthase I [Pseudacidovorax intermedius]|uniref:Photosynthetic protein synthase I n=1 Tax=Pseudacidovorax intermedius TaxID=433924 RepID=A0A147H6W8_9BURK|nr:photosynthetic protein synthase I [Pseudacidovorax intermedius]
MATAAPPLSFPRSRRRFVQAGLLSPLGLMLAGCDGFRPPRLAVNGVDITGAAYAQDFRLLDPDGKERTLADFRGQAVLMFFGFTQCPDVCPTALTRASRIRELLGPLGSQLQVIFVTLDPERDTPEVLRAYTAAFDPSFLGLYTDVEGTAQTAKAFRVYYRKVPTGASYTMDHSALSYLYDPQGRVRVVLRHELSAEQCAADVRQLLAKTA